MTNEKVTQFLVVQQKESYRGVYVVLVSLIPVNFSFFGPAKRKLSRLRDRTILEFFVQSSLKIGHSLISRLDKKIKRVDKI